jgi:non-homologous end joining protein Ku
VDAETGDEVDSSDIIKGYEVGKGQYIEIESEDEDHYEDALKELLKKKQAGEKIDAPKERAPAKVINLMDALRRSVEAERGGPAKRQAPRGRQPERPK